MSYRGRVVDRHLVTLHVVSTILLGVSDPQTEFFASGHEHAEGLGRSGLPAAATLLAWGVGGTRGPKKSTRRVEVRDAQPTKAALCFSPIPGAHHWSALGGRL